MDIRFIVLDKIYLNNYLLIEIMSDNLEEQDTGDLGSNQNDNEEEETKASSDQPLRNSQTSSNKKNKKKGAKGKKKVAIVNKVIEEE